MKPTEVAAAKSAEESLEDDIFEQPADPSSNKDLDSILKTPALTTGRGSLVPNTN